MGLAGEGEILGRITRWLVHLARHHRSVRLRDISPSSQAWCGPLLFSRVSVAESMSTQIREKVCSKRCCRIWPVVIDCIRRGLEDVLLACKSCAWRVHQNFFSMCLPIEDVETIDRCFASVLSTWRGIIICTWQAVIPFSERVTLDIVHQAARYG